MSKNVGKNKKGQMMIKKPEIDKKKLGINNFRVFSKKWKKMSKT
jgi:hypothetical protein